MVFETLGGSLYEALWEVPIPLASPDAGGEPPAGFPYMAGPGRARFLRLVIPPDSEATPEDIGAALVEVQAKAPSLLSSLDPARGPGVHRTSSVDYVVIVSGRLMLALESGELQLAAGDCVVQRGTWHAWRNPFAEPAVMVAVMVTTH